MKMKIKKQIMLNLLVCVEVCFYCEYKLIRLYQRNIIFLVYKAMELKQFEHNQEPQEGRWAQDQHLRFLKGIVQHGKDWKLIESIVKTRTGSQVRSHSQKFFIKLNKISKDRKKGKSLELFSPTDIQKEILDTFTEDDFTQNTPDEIKYVVKHDWTVPENLPSVKKRVIKAKHVTQLKKISMTSNFPFKCSDTFQQDDKKSEKNVQPSQQSQSFFIQILKMQKEHLMNGNQFKNLIDFGQKQIGFIDEPQTSYNGVAQLGFPVNTPQIISDRHRRRSFGLPDEEQDPQKLKETLEHLHKAWDSQN